MDDQTQNIETDIEIKEELLVDFSESGNQNKNVIFEHQNSISSSDTSEKSAYHLKMDPIKVEIDNTYNNIEAILEDQNATLNHVEIKEENIDDEICQINDPLDLQQQQKSEQLQQAQNVKLRVSNDKFNRQFCLSWIKTTYKLMNGSKIEKQEMFKQYLFSLNNLGIGSVISEQNFATCVRTLFGESVGPSKKQMPDDTVQFFYNGIQKRNGISTAERAECPKCGQYKSKSNMSKHIRICQAEVSVGKVENRNKRQLPDNSIDGKSKFHDQNKDKILKIFEKKYLLNSHYIYIYIY